MTKDEQTKEILSVWAKGGVKAFGKAKCEFSINFDETTVEVIFRIPKDGLLGHMMLHALTKDPKGMVERVLKSMKKDEL